jgi:hypothetical protein
MKTQAKPSAHDHPDVVAKRAEIAKVNERLKQAELREQAARQRLRDLAPVIRTADVAQKKASAADKVRKLLSGGVVSAADPAAELEAALREQDILHDAQCELATELHQIIGALSDEFTTNYLAPLVRDDTVEIYEHLSRGAAAMARVRGRAADALRLGYRVSSGSCPDLVPPAAWGLGDPANTGVRARAHAPRTGGKGMDEMSIELDVRRVELAEESANWRADREQRSY